MQKDKVKSFIDGLEAKAGRELKVRNGYDIEKFAKTLFNTEVELVDNEFEDVADDARNSDFTMPDDIQRFLFFKDRAKSIWLEDTYAFARFLGIEDLEHDIDPQVPRYHLDVRIINSRLAIEWWEFTRNW